MNAETFWTQVGLYNQTTLTVQVILTIAALIWTYPVVAKPVVKTAIWMKAFLVYAFAWNGMAFFLILIKNSISTIFETPLFIILSAT